MFFWKFNRVEAVCSCFYLTLIFLSIPSTLSTNGNDENRPYEFGFSIENQQHRHEAKDAEGLVNGEFGFITGDGVYHVTVYATDKDGKFIIKSMESYKVSPPLDGSPDLSGIPIEYSITDLQNRVKSKITTPAPLPPKPVTQLQVAQKPVISIDAKPVRLTTSRPVSKTDPPKIEFTTLRPLNVASCGGCSIPSTTRVPFGKPNQFQFQTPEFQNPGVELPLEPGTKPGYETGSVDNYQELLIRPNPGVNVISTEVLQPPNQGIQPGYSPRPNEIDSPVNQGTQPGYAPRPNEIDNPVNQPIDNPSYENLSNPGKNPISSPVNSPNSPVNQPIYNPSYENLPNPGENPFSSPVNSPSRPVNQPIYNPSYENLPNPGKNPISSPVNSPNNPVNPVDPPVSTGTGNIGASQSKPPKPATSLSQQPKPTSNNIPPTKPRPSHEITFFPGLIHAPEDPQQEQVPITGNLPPGITVGDMTELLYRFNYSVGFHGHYETGYRSGVRIGGYYINYRDGYSRIVEYVADENGYRPKTSLVYLGFDSPDIPKEETEKEFGLKGQVFEWFSL